MNPRITKKLSRTQLLTFAAVFTAIFGYLTYNSFAASLLAASLQAEQMSLPTGASVYNDASASGGQAVRITNSSATLNASVDLPNATDSLTISAKGTSCKNVAPKFTLSIDGTQVISNTVTATNWNGYSIPKSLATGVHTVSIAATNSVTPGKGGCSTILYLDVVNFYSVIPAPTINISASPTSVDAGESTTLTWSSTNAVSCTASGSWSGAQPTSGTYNTDALNISSIYTLNCTGLSGNASASTTVIVNSSSAVSWQNGLDSWGEANIPDATWRPFADDSVWNTKVPAAPPLAVNSDSIINRVFAFDGDADKAPANVVHFPDIATANGNDWSHPLYFSKPTDPLLTIHCTVYSCQDLEGKTIPVPAAAQPALGGDGHFGLVLRDNSKSYNLYVVDLWRATAKPATGTWNVSSGGISRIDGTGQNFDIDSAWNYLGPTGQSEATAARFSTLAGMPRGPEIAAHQIPHAIFMAVNCDSGSFVYPAQKTGRPCSAIGQSNVDAPPMGTHFWLDMDSVSIDDLSVKPTLKTFLHTLADYGGFVGDTGCGNYCFYFESPMTYYSYGLASPLTDVAIQENWALYNGYYVLKPTEVPDSVWANLKVLDQCVDKKSC